MFLFIRYRIFKKERLLRIKKGFFMRMAVDFCFTSPPKIPVFYRKNLLSLLRDALKNSPVYDRYYYAPEQNLMKPFTFSLSIPGCRKGDSGYLETSFQTLRFAASSSDFLWIECLYDGLRKLKTYPLFDNQQAEFQKFCVFPKKEIRESSVFMKTLSPVAVRRIVQRANGKMGAPAGGEPGDRYLTLNDPCYWESLSHSMALQCQDLGIAPKEIVFEPELEACRQARVAMKNARNGKGYSILASSLFFKIHAPQEALQRIYDQGLGAHKSMGFGMLETDEPRKPLLTED